MKGSILLLLVLFTTTIIGCQDKEESVVIEENNYMVELLNQQHEKVNALDVTYYFNAKRAIAYDSLRKKFERNFETYISYNYWYIRETLNSGETTKAIELLQAFDEQLNKENKSLPEQWDYFYKRLGALSYIRLGEQVNCLTNHTTSSCILPISDDGIHINTDGSEQAIAIIENILVDYPDDLELVWLLNLSYQTIGKYPEFVPEEYLIPETAFKSEPAIQKFIDLAPQLGLATSGIAGGSIMEDFNNDDYLDIVTTSSGFTSQDQMRLYINNGRGGFNDETETSGLTGLVGGLNCQQTDYNNDGLKDIFVLRGGWFGPWGKHPNSLLRNNGDGTFTDVTKEAGLLSMFPTQTAAWADFNNDGWLDVFIGNESFIPPGVSNRESLKRTHKTEFYINQGDGTFKNMAEESGLDFVKMVKGVVAFDANNDNLLDLYLSVNQGENVFLINKGDLEFEDVTAKLDMAYPIESFPVGAFDYNNDGFEDLLVAGYSSTDKPLSHEYMVDLMGKEAQAALPILYKNNGDGTFSDVTEEARLNHSIYAMGFNYGDLNNDGYLDLYFGTGDPNFESIIPNRMFLNIDGQYFEEVTFTGGFSNIQKGHGISWGDIDNDGDDDIYITLGGAHEGDIYQNQLLMNPQLNGNWINITLEGRESNRAAIGTKVHLITSLGKHIYRTVSQGASFGANSYRLKIGLDNADEVEKLEIIWPTTDKKQLFENLEVNQFIRIIEGHDEIEKIEIAPLKLNPMMHMATADH